MTATFEHCVTFKEIDTPLPNVKREVDTKKFQTDWDTVEHDGFTLPAIEDPHYWCGEWKCKGCLDYQEHEKLGYGKKIYVKQFQSSCYRPYCKICYLKWIARQANRSTQRIEQYQKKIRLPPIHIYISAPLCDYDLPLEKLRKKVYRILKEVGFFYAEVVFHGFRLKKPAKSRWYWSPHFHVVGYGDIRGKLEQIRLKYGWKVGYKGIRKSVFQTMCYLLSHCAINKSYQAVTRWCNPILYGKVILQKEPKTYNRCPYCNQKMIDVYHESPEPVVPPRQYFEGLVDFEGWRPQYSIPYSKLDDRFDYAPTRDLNETLKELATAN